MPNLMAHTPANFQFTSQTIRPEDFCRTYSENNVQVGACQVQGPQPSQEDAFTVSVDAVEGFDDLTTEAQQFAYSQTFKILQEQYGERTYGGSTGIAATVWLDLESQNVNVCLANLGDSLLIAVIADEIKNKYYAKQLNTLHRPTNPEEAGRVAEEGGVIQGNRLLDYTDIYQRHFGLTRALGDKGVPGMSHTPEIRRVYFNVAVGQKVFFILASDGMQVLPTRLVGKLVGSNSQKSLAEIANLLVDAAYQAKPMPSTDNITAIVMCPSTKPVSAALFDGHRGNHVSSLCAEHFNKILHTNICLVQTPAALNLAMRFEDQREQTNKIVEDTQAKLTEKNNASFIQQMTENTGFDARMYFESDPLTFAFVCATNGDTQFLKAVKTLAANFQFEIQSAAFSYQEHEAYRYRYHIVLSTRLAMMAALENYNQFVDAIKDKLSRMHRSPRPRPLTISSNSAGFFSRQDLSPIPELAEIVTPNPLPEPQGNEQNPLNSLLPCNIEVAPESPESEETGCLRGLRKRLC